MNAARSRAIERVVTIGASAAAAVLVAMAARTIIVKERLGDFPHFYSAAEAVVAGTDLQSSGDGGYIYPPLLAFLLQPMTWLSTANAPLLWLGINAVLLALGVVLASREAIRRLDLPASGRALALVASLAFLLTLDKTRATLNQGQTDSLVILGFVLGLRWLERRPAMSGLALGFAANIKYLSLITLPYLIVRRRWSAAAWTVAFTIAWAVLPAVSLGWSENLAALGRAGAGLLGALGVAVESDAAQVHADNWHLSLSVTSAVSRLVGSAASPILKVAATGSVALVMLALVWAVYAKRGRSLLGAGAARIDAGKARVTALEWAGLIVACLAFGPQTTGRHLVLLLPVHAIVATVLVRPAALHRNFALIAAVVLFQLAMVLPPGGRGLESAVDAWRAVGGASWCLLAMYLALLWVGLPGREGPGSPTIGACGPDGSRVGRRRRRRRSRGIGAEYVMGSAGVLLVSAAAYGAIGLLFACGFVLRGVGRIDPVAAHAGWGFRLLILPGAAALWPVLLLKWVSVSRRLERSP